MNCQQCKDMGPSPDGYFRQVFGTADGQWHTVCPHDRDYETAITWEYFTTWGEVLSREKYLSANVVNHAKG